MKYCINCKKEVDFFVGLYCPPCKAEIEAEDAAVIKAEKARNDRLQHYLDNRRGSGNPEKLASGRNALPTDQYGNILDGDENN